MIGDFKHIMMKEFEMSDLGLMSYFLVIYLGLHSSKEICCWGFKKFKMEDSNPIKTLIGKNMIKLEYCILDTIKV